MSEARILPTLERKMQRLADLGEEELLKRGAGPGEIQFLAGLRKRGIFFGTPAQRERIDQLGRKVFRNWDTYCRGRLVGTSRKVVYR